MTEGNGKPGKLSLKSWTRVYFDTGWSFEARRLKRHEVPELQKLVAKVIDKMGEGVGENVTAARQAEVAAEAVAVLSERELAEVFERYVRDVEGFEMDGVAITTGPELLKQADQDTALQVLIKIMGASKLSATEGNVTRSPSTLSPEAAGASSSSAAPPTESVDGIARFDATESQDKDLSSPRAEA